VRGFVRSRRFLVARPEGGETNRLVIWMLDQES
jgi:hypothetical protein